ncbi:E3 ubiquitin-protein ligase TRIM21-like [Echeneis naucrates]|uniref:E3 ubiquitin-protein ligase TRIM21-like n=1 Tax=Echeneis naucrates TaxID=173247 RepID=A0A665V8G6_ECHNA|nr:E3 ubiquitin-protein ligase TRIM21-like [Echeneis naucrates]
MEYIYIQYIYIYFIFFLQKSPFCLIAKLKYYLILRNMASVLTEAQFRCSICLDIFNNPVSIPCGHNFCLKCIKRFWDSKPTPDCPLCKETFKTRPPLRINVGLKDITAGFKKIMKTNTLLKTNNRLTPRQKVLQSNISCDMCYDNKLAAVKSCLSCQLSYCEGHLMPHLKDQTLVMHSLTDPTTFTHLCRVHKKLLVWFCRDDQMPVCVKCIEEGHKHHRTVPIEKEGKKIKHQIMKSESEVKQMIQAITRKTEEIKISVELSKTEKEQEICSSAQVFTKVVSDIERNQALLVEEMQQKQEELERGADEFLEELKQEKQNLQTRYNQLHNLLVLEDPLHFLQSVSSLTAPQHNKEWSQFKLPSDIYIRTVRRTFSKLVEFCHGLENKLSAEELSKANKYAADITLDPVTAAGWLLLSPDGKKVSIGNQQRKVSVPADPRRFDSCVSVLGKQSFTSGRHYWVVQVGDKTDWDLGVAKESINRKGAITVRPDAGYWAICRRKGGCLSACAGPSVPLHLQETPQKVGIFLDYGEGWVSFYNTEAKTHIYTFSGCTFTEPLYPYFNPCVQDNGRNTAPLVICPVETVSPTDRVIL